MKQMNENSERVIEEFLSQKGNGNGGLGGIISNASSHNNIKSHSLVNVRQGGNGERSLFNRVLHQENQDEAMDIHPINALNINNQNINISPY
jgi:hypothetical protein